MRCKCREAHRQAGQAQQASQALRKEAEQWRGRAERAESRCGTLEESLRDAAARHARLARAAEESEGTRVSAVGLALAAEESLAEEQAYAARLRDALLRAGLEPPPRRPVTSQRFSV